MSSSGKKSKRQRHVTIVGAGLVGSLAALALGKRGYRVDVYEGRPDYRKHGYSGKSINLALSKRGIVALERAGIMDKVTPLLTPMYGRMLHAVDGSLTFQSYGQDDEAIFSVSRQQLNEIMLTEAERSKHVSFYFDHRLDTMELRGRDRAQCKLTNTTTGMKLETRPGVVFGCDGAFSKVRRAVTCTDRVDASQMYITHGYKELCIPATADGDFALPMPERLHIWPRNKFMLIALPNEDRSFTVTIFLPFEGEESFASLTTDDAITAFFKKHFADAVPLMPSLVEDFKANPMGSLVTTQVKPWNYRDQVLLLGDAAHAMVPFFGQGMNCGFEDVYLLDVLLDEMKDDLGAAIKRFGATRKVDTDAIQALALHNYITMRDSVTKSSFLFRKKVDKMLNRMLPGVWIPMYSAVSFTTIPYSEASAIGKRHDRWYATVGSVFKWGALTGLAYGAWKFLGNK